ncbi:MAG: hypothetical protein SFW67_11510 [Myxococcaceae bacterium]|nr:hypothetical protein [Myxococcaceae bacterium]
MSRRTPTRGSSVALFFLSLPFLAVGLVTAPWAASFWADTRFPAFGGQGLRDAGELAWGLSSFFLMCGVSGLVWAVRDFVSPPSGDGSSRRP